MLQVKVYIGDNGNICISQGDFGNTEPSIIAIHPEQVDLLIKWLQKAKKESKKEFKNECNPGTF
jgi:hypothetical protein